MTDSVSSSTLRFNGSLWCNLDIALRALDQMLSRVIQPEGLTLIEWYVLRALYERDGLHASELARTVGRAATSFTPNLDKLERRGLITRKQDERDRRAILIRLTPEAETYRVVVRQSAEQIDQYLHTLVSCDDLHAFWRVLLTLQQLDREQADDLREQLSASVG